MGTDFEWRFGDQLPEDEQARGESSQRAWRRWLPWLLTLLLIAGGAYAWWHRRQLNLAQAEAEVQQVARLELRALSEGDAELYLSLQDPLDRSWKEAQANYVDTAALPLPLQNVTTPISTSVESARVVGSRARVDIAYAASLPSGDEARFRAARFYRYANDGRWLHTGAIPEDLGHTVTFIVDDIKIASFASDAEWLEPLTSQVAETAYRFCRLAGCRRDLSLSLSLAANLEQGADPDDSTLPAPLLVGAPQNQAARTAWQASLGQFLVDQLVSREIGPRPEGDEEGAFVEERLRAWLKAELALSAPVDPDLELVRDALRSERWIPFWRLWNVTSDSPDRDLAAAQIDLLLALIAEERGAQAVAQLIHTLREAEYLMAFLGETNRHWGTVESRYLTYVRQRTARSTGQLGAFPAYDLLIPCDETVQWIDVVDIWGWRLGEEEAVLLSTRPSSRGFYPISWSPAGTRLLLEREPSPDLGYAVLEAGSAEPELGMIPERAQAVGSYYGVRLFGGSGWSPDGSLLAYHVYGPNSERPGLETRIVDVNSGDETALNGRFIAWSPGGSHLLYATSSDVPSGALGSERATLHDWYVVDRRSNASRRVGTGYEAAWSPDGQRVAYVGADQALVVHHLATDRRTSVIEPALLRESLGFEPRAAPAYASPFILTWSPEGDGLALGVSEFGDERPLSGAILLARDDEVRVLRREEGGVHNLAWAPDGRWLKALVVGQGLSTVVMAPDGSLLLARRNAVATWSPDGRYLALTSYIDEDAGLEILEMATGRLERISLPSRCWPPLWNPRGPRDAH